jgi:integrase
MSLWKRGRQYWTDFTVNGRRYRKRLGTTNLRVATRREREVIEEARYGRLPLDEQGLKRLSEAIDAYLTAKHIRCSARTIELEEERLSIVKKHFGDLPLSAITATAIADFQHARHDAGKANRTINMDVGVLSRVLKSCGRWRALAGHVKNLPERQRPIGRALTSEERRRLFDVAASNPEWEHVYCAAIVAANTSMRPVEVKHIRRCDVDLVKRLLHVRRSKNETSHRVIPLNASAIEAVARMLERADLLGHTEPEHYLWPACQWGRYDPTKPMLQWDTAWRALTRRRRPAPSSVPRPAAHGHHRARGDGRRRSRARVDQRPPVSPDARALLARPNRRQAPGSRCVGCRPTCISEGRRQQRQRQRRSARRERN